MMTLIGRQECRERRCEMTVLAVILTVFLVAMIVDRVMLTDRVHELEMKLRDEHYKED